MEHRRAEETYAFFIGRRRSPRTLFNSRRLVPSEIGIRFRAASSQFPRRRLLPSPAVFYSLKAPSWIARERMAVRVALVELNLVESPFLSETALILPSSPRSRPYAKRYRVKRSRRRVRFFAALGSALFPRSHPRPIYCPAKCGALKRIDRRDVARVFLSYPSPPTPFNRPWRSGFSRLLSDDHLTPPLISQGLGDPKFR